MSAGGHCTVSVNPATCEGTGLCEAVAGALFRLDEDDVARPLVSRVPADLVDLAQEAEQMCPTRSISVEAE